MATLLLKNIAFLVQDAQRTLRSAALYIEGATIQDVGPSAELERRCEAGISIDLSGCIVTPDRKSVV